MITFMTHNQALMWSRFERMCAVAAIIAIVFFLESLAPAPTWLFGTVTLFVGELVILKCWADMAVRSEPYKNCWAFKG